MTKLTVFRRQASVDTYVTLRLTRGEDVSGRIVELDDAHVCLDLGGRETITVFEDILAGWEIHRQNRVDAAVDESGKHRAVAEHASRTSSDAASHLGAAEGNADESPKTHSALARVEASFSEAIKRARLEFPEPDFQFSEAGFPSWRVPNIRREWDRARNQYAYALKVREIGRLSSIVAQILDPLAQAGYGSLGRWTYVVEGDPSNRRSPMGCNGGRRGGSVRDRCIWALKFNILAKVRNPLARNRAESVDDGDRKQAEGICREILNRYRDHAKTEFPA